MFTNITRVLVIASFLAGCSSTQPVVAIMKSGQVLRGTTTASLQEGSFDGPHRLCKTSLSVRAL